MSICCGWDIGGVHLKVAGLVTTASRPRAASGAESQGAARFAWRQDPFEIWGDPQALEARLRMLRQAVHSEIDAPAEDMHHAVTMTAELSDVFADRASGVRTILAATQRALLAGPEGGDGLLVLDQRGRLRPIGAALEAPLEVAAANWMATATLAARLHASSFTPRRRALLIDVGSTTTDIIAIAEGRPEPRGFTDLDRLQSGELLYTGLLRTPPAALADRVPLGESWCRVSPEHFTNMADVQVILGRIAPESYTTRTPDGRGRSRAECAARLARLVCSEPASLGEEALLTIAEFLADRQVDRIVEAARQVVGGRPSGGGPAEPVVIAAGCGWFLAQSAAQRAGWPAVRLSRLVQVSGRPAGDDWDVAAPAASLALLLAESRGEPLPLATTA